MIQRDLRECQPLKFLRRCHRSDIAYVPTLFSPCTNAAEGIDMRLAVTHTGRYAIQRCADALSDLQLRLLSLADGSRTSESLVLDCQFCDYEVAWQALAELLELELLAPYGTPRTLADGRQKRKRSTAAAKMYLVAIFERVKRSRASVILQALHAARNEHDLLEVVRDTIPFLEAQASSGFASNVVIELGQMLPEEYGEALDQLLAKTLRDHKKHRPRVVSRVA